MASVNKVILVGRVGQDPQVRNFDSGNFVVNFSVATSSGKDKSGQEITDWHRCQAFGGETQKVGQICAQYIKKGILVYIEGALRTRKWVDKDSGLERSSTEIIVNSVQLLSPKSESGNPGAGASTTPAFGQSNAPTRATLDDVLGSPFNSGEIPF